MVEGRLGAKAGTIGREKGRSLNQRGNQKGEDSVGECRQKVEGRKEAKGPNFSFVDADEADR